MTRYFSKPWIDLVRARKISAIPPAAAASGRITLAEAERRHIEAVLREERGAVASAAEVLGLSRSALYERIKKHGIVAAKGTET